MVRNYENHVCNICGQFKPRCLHVKFKRGGAKVLCEDCRKKMRGKFVVDVKHKGAG